jgi:hypothetical protein
MRENCPIPAKDGLEALAIDCEDCAVRLSEYRRLLRSVQETRAFSKEIAIGENCDGHHARRSFDHHPAATLLDEKDGVAWLALAHDHLAACYGDAPQAPGERPQDPFRESEQDGCSLEHCDPFDHFVVRGPAVLGVLP